MTEDELITLVAFYDTNENRDTHMVNIENLLRRMDISQGTIIGADFNNFSDNIRDQRGRQARPHYRTKATLKHAEWKADHKFMDIYRINYPDGKDLSYIPPGMDRRRIDNGTRLDKFVVTEDLMDKSAEIIHTKDYFYTKEYGMKDNPFDHGSVQLKYNVTKTESGPGQFKLDPYLVKTGALDSVIKQSIYEANLFNTENPGLIRTYEQRNKIVVPLLQRIVDIEKERIETDNPGLDEEEEHNTLLQIDREDAKLPKLDHLIALNELTADRVLTEIQNSIGTKVKTVQLQLKKEAKNKLKSMIKELDKLNNELENTDDQNIRDRMLEAREAFNSKYHNHFKREADKTTLFNQMNIEKPTKWFMNLASDKMTNDSPFSKLKKNGRKYENREEMLDDANKHYSNIFKRRPRPAGVSIEAFLRNLKDKPEVLLKKLTEEEKSTADRKIEEKELKKTLDKVSAGKTPGIDGIEKEYLTRYWRLIGKTIADASGIFVEKEKTKHLHGERTDQSHSKR